MSTHCVDRSKNVSPFTFPLSADRFYYKSKSTILFHLEFTYLWAMADINKNTASILAKLGIAELNPMQVAAQKSITEHEQVVLLSPTGTGKTLAYLLPIISGLDRTIHDVQVLILVPSRELAIQIEQVTREMGSGFKANAVYGGRAVMKDKIDLATPPAILIGTPGRIADHMRRETINTDHVKTLVLDEFDKSLEVGFADDMHDIIYSIPYLEKKILTSATQKVEIPKFIQVENPETLNFLDEKIQQLQKKIVVAADKHKLDDLVKLLKYIGRKNGIVFCNLKDSIEDVHQHLNENRIDHATFFGGMDQKDRERALIKFRNGTHRLLVATDLAARGLDVPEMDFIIHYELPYHEEEFIHRNGRTARMHNEGTAYILKWTKENLPDFITTKDEIVPVPKDEPLKREWETIFISGGRKDKISKGDIAGLFLKQGNLDKNELGIIELKSDCAFVSVPYKKAYALAKQLNNTRLKKKKVRIHVI